MVQLPATAAIEYVAACCTTRTRTRTRTKMKTRTKTETKTKTKTRNTLDCDQSNYSSRIVFSHIPIVLGQTGIKIRQTRKPHIRTKHGVNRTIRRGDIAI